MPCHAMRCLMPAPLQLGKRAGARMVDLAATVDQNGDAAYVGSVIAQQEGDHARYVFRRASAAQRCSTSKGWR